MRPSLRFLTIVTGLILAAFPAIARAQQPSNRVVRVTVHPGRLTVEPGDQLRVAVIFDHDHDWHIHTNDPQVPPELGEASFYVATRIDATVSADNALIPHTDKIKWPPIHTANVAFGGGPSVDYDVFSGRAIAYIPVTVRRDAVPGLSTLTVAATYQACDDKQCLAPVERELHAFTVNITGPGAAPPFEDTYGLFGEFPEDVWPGLEYGQAPDTSSRSSPGLWLWMSIGAGVVVIAVAFIWLLRR